ncbi:hypothetical protein [Nocardia salmonicida]
MADRETRTHRTGDGDGKPLTGSGYRNGLESLTTTRPQTVQQIQSTTTSQSQTTSGTDRHDIDD